MPVAGRQVQVGQGKSGEFGDLLFVRRLRSRGDETNEPLDAPLLLGDLDFQGCLPVRNGKENLEHTFARLQVLAHEQIDQ